MVNSSAVLDRVFHALGDPTRRGIIEQLSERPVSVSTLAAPLDMSLAAVMQHIRVLEISGLVRTTKTGRTRTCALEPDALSSAARWLTERRRSWESHFDRLGEFLATDDPADTSSATIDSREQP